MFEKKGDLLQATEDIIVHQCNCVTKVGAGLSKSIHEKFPYADIYKNNPERIPGTAILSGNGKEYRYIASICSQYYPGKGDRYPNDTYLLRRSWLEKGLRDLAYFMTSNQLKTIAIPYNMGCGLAGDDWEQIKAILTKIEDMFQISVIIYIF